jgi:hypothetical protein
MKTLALHLYCCRCLTIGVRLYELASVRPVLSTCLAEVVELHEPRFFMLCTLLFSVRSRLVLYWTDMDCAGNV